MRRCRRCRPPRSSTSMSTASPRRVPSPPCSWSWSASRRRLRPGNFRPRWPSSRATRRRRRPGPRFAEKAQTQLRDAGLIRRILLAGGVLDRVDATRISEAPTPDADADADADADE